MREPGEFTFRLDDKWFMKINEKGIEFNKKDFSHFLVDDFAREFIKIIEDGYKDGFTSLPITNALQNHLLERNEDGVFTAQVDGVHSFENGIIIPPNASQNPHLERNEED